MRAQERGFMLVVAMIVLLVATLLVVGALAFTGSEKGAAVNQLRGEVLSSCTQAARNMFLSRVSVLRGNVGSVVMDAGIDLGPYPGEKVQVRTGHFDGSGTSGVQLIDVVRLKDQDIAGSTLDVQDLSNRLGDNPLLAGFYDITVLCKDTETGAQQEVEFVVRLGL
jgi:hypothetical protein